jgi:hypothetical protein
MTKPIGSTKDLFAHKSPTAPQKIAKNSISFTKNEENECTSCSYGKRIKSTKPSSKTNSNGSKLKKLCPCHKSYIETSDFLY